LFLYSGEFHIGGAKNRGFLGWKKKFVKEVTLSNGLPVLELIKHKNENIIFSHDFETKKADINKYSFKYNESYPLLNSQEVAMGKSSALFRGKQGGWNLDIPESLGITKGRLLKEMYISFYFLPKEITDRGELFSKITLHEGKQNGIRIHLENGEYVISLLNFFRKPDGSAESVRVKYPIPPNTSEWTHITLYFLPQFGKVRIWENTLERDALTISSPKEAFFLGFPENAHSPYKFGDGFVGSIDEIEIGYGAPISHSQIKVFPSTEWNESLYTYDQNAGEATSPIYATEYSHSVWKEGNAVFDLPDQTHGEAAIRTSPTPFSEKDETLNWIPFNQYFSMKEKPFFKYYQFKMRIRSDAMGHRTPAFHGIHAEYLENKPPLTPTGFKLAQLDIAQENVCFSWSSNREDTVKKGGGYRIHLGVHEDRMISVLDKLQNAPITGLDPAKPNRYDVLNACVSKEDLIQHASEHKDQNVVLWKPGLAVYFRLSAYTKFYNDSFGNDQKSGLTPAILIRFPENWNE
jgi:hypothetical protein